MTDEDFDRLTRRDDPRRRRSARGRSYTPTRYARVSLADITLTCSLFGSGGIRGGAAGAGAGEGGRAGTGSGGAQGADTGEAREVRREEAAEDRRVGVLSEEDHGVEVGAGEEVEQ